MGVYNAMKMAVGVMESIEEVLSSFFSQVITIYLRHFMNWHG